MTCLIQEPDSFAEHPTGGPTSSYGGPYTIAEEPGTGIVVTHHVQAALTPSWIGMKRRRLPDLAVVNRKEILTIAAVDLPAPQHEMSAVAKWRRADGGGKE